MLKFKGLTYADFLSQYDLSKLRFFPKCQTESERIKPEGKVIYLRHDIDSNFNASVQMAEYEHSRGIKSTYFALHFSDYWTKPDTWVKLRAMQDMGHEIGFHNAVVTELLVRTGAIPTMHDVVMVLESHLATMRSEGLYIRGTSGHGHPTCVSHNYANAKIFDIMSEPNGIFGQLKLDDFGLEYDSNGVYRNLYHSDSSNKWNGEPDNVAQVFNKLDNVVLMINLHPQWWV